MPGIGIILNPHSRSNRNNPERVKRLGFIVGDKGACKATQDVMDLETILHEFKERKIDILGISGGDGTNHCTLTKLVKKYGETPLPKIAFLRGGTMNAIANALDIHGSPEQILSNLILKYHEDKLFDTAEVDLLNVNDNYGFLFGNGLISKFIDRYNSNKGGPLSVFTLLMQASFGTLFNSRFALDICERFDAEVTVDGKKWGFKNFVFIDAGTMESFSFGFKPFYRARTQPGYFQILGCSMKPRQVFGSFPRIWFGKPQRPEFYEDSMAKEVEIRLTKPQIYMFDGDVFPATDCIKLKTGPRLTMIIR